MSPKPRLRFAPSPTGYLHIGGVRTALFNWLWARKTGGAFILRIEDTDQARSTPENEAIILRDMRWLGLTWDEGPGVGGEHGPYRQMERLPLYREFAEKLIARGAAYRCTCTKEELDEARKAVKARDPKAEFRYPGTCRDKTGPAPDKPWVLRMKAPSSGAVTYHDLVFGEVTTPNSTQQDQVLMRADGVPLYNFGAVVDDVTMGITLVARGRDHMINTPVQILLYEALGYKAPPFAHLPMMLGADGQKLSKRHGAVAVGEYRDKGYPASGLLNYLVRFGWSYGDEEVFSMQDLIQKFDWERCGTADGKYDIKKFSAVTFEHMKRADLTSEEAYTEGVMEFLAARGLGGADRAIVTRALPLIRPRAQTYADAADALDYVFRDEPVYDAKAVAKFLVPGKVELLRGLEDRIVSAPTFEKEPLEAHVAAWLADRGVEMKEVAQAARVAITGRSASPGLFEVMELLGRDKVAVRLKAGAAMAEAQAGKASA